MESEILKKKGTPEELQLKAQQLQLGLNAPETSATFLNTKAEQMRAAKAADEADAKFKQLQEAGASKEQIFPVWSEAKRQRTMAGGAQYDPTELARLNARSQIATERESRAGSFGPSTREAKITGEQIGMEIEAHESRRQGRGKEAQATENLLEFTKKFDELLPVLGKEGAAKTAEEETIDTIKGRVLPEVGMSAVASSLTRIGGGGGVYTPGGDATDIAKQANDLHRQAIVWLEKIYGKEGGVE
jgi:hypothetical protein